MPHMIDWLMEIGPMVSGAMGSAAFGWSDMAHWSEMTGIELDPWEAKTLRRLSLDWVAQVNASREPNCPPPYVENVRNDDAVTEQFKRMFAAMKK